MTKTQKLKIQKIAQRFIDLCYRELKTPGQSVPFFVYWINDREFVEVEYLEKDKKWECTIENCFNNTSTVIEI